MKAVIPVKRTSARVPNKNFREFYRGESLLAIKLDQLTAHLDRTDIYLSSEDPDVGVIAEEAGVNFLPRDPVLARNETPYAYVVSQICRQVPGDDDIAWCHVTDPLFNDYGNCLAAWQKHREGHDSLVVVYPFRGYLLDSDYAPIGFGFGPWHRPSQALPTHYQLGFTLSLLRRVTALSLGPVGARPYWFHAANRTVDIDDESDFYLAQAIFEHLTKEELL
jgi:CMP-N-acetylneuraminic acid synthetase